MLNKYLAKFVLVSFSVTLVLALRLAPWPSMVPCPDALAGGGYTYTVNTVGDENDGSCSDGDCSLRDAIILANSIPGSHLINFDIQSGCGGLICTIHPTTPLPPLTGGAIHIDGSNSNKWIQINGDSAGDSHGFEVTSAYNVIKGLAIKKFQKDGVYISGSSATDNVISENYIGTDASSTANQGNGLNGVYIGKGAQNNTVEDNVISGNGGASGIVIMDSDTMNNTVSGNYIGGNTSDEQNVISGNSGNGVMIVGVGTTGNVVLGNLIGTNTSVFELGNIYNGITIGGGRSEQHHRARQRHRM
jgi:CSLREA domain-containing protein